MLVVEHDPDVIEIADHVVEVGPGAGAHGGEVVFEGAFDQLREAGTATGLGLRRAGEVKRACRAPTGKLPVSNVTLHNLRDVSVDVPAGVLTLKLRLDRNATMLPLDREATFARLTANRNDAIRCERLFLLYAKQWWKEVSAMPSHHRSPSP